MAATKYNQSRLEAGDIKPAHLTALCRLWQERYQLDVDGKCGPATLESIQRAFSESDTPTDLKDLLPGEPPDQEGRDGILQTFEGPLLQIPSTRRDIDRVFGNPGPVSKPSRHWRRANIITVRDLPGVPKKWFVKVHRLAEPYLREALARTQMLGAFQIERLGCWVHRHIRHDSCRPLSLHSWGIAVDINPEDNQSHTFIRGQCPAPWSDDWMKIWPRGVTRQLVEAFESVGWTWGGAWGTAGESFAERIRRVSYCDPTHLELRIR